MPFDRVEIGRDGSVTYIDDQNNRATYRGGHPAWRNNNPGNLVDSPFTRRHGRIGVNRIRERDFAVFRMWKPEIAPCVL